MSWDFLPDVLDLARIQFAFTVIWHFLFPALTIGLASFLAVLEGLWLWTGRAIYIDVYRYWLKVFAVNFAMGVVSGIVLSYQFGTNWAVFSERVGNVLGPLMGYEVLTAFFLEAGFLGVMLFGLNRVGKRLHFLATCLVAIGTAISAFWILAANSWMHTPQGYFIDAKGIFLPLSFWEIIFNPSFPYRLIHTVTATYLTTALIVGGVAGFHLLKNVQNQHAQLMLSMSLWMALLVAPLQAIFGDMHGLNTLKYQPQKVAAMEGHWETQEGAPLILFGLPDAQEEETRYAVEIPKLGSLILGHSTEAEIKGLKAFPKEDRPTNIALIFWAFRVMVGLGFLMIFFGIAGFILRCQKKLFVRPWFLRWAVIMGPTGLLAVSAGWIVTECGRQPFTVYGLLRTADSLSPVAAPAVATSLLAFIIVYFIVFGAGIYYLFRLFSQTPHAHEIGVPIDQPIRSAGITPAPGIESLDYRNEKE